MPHFPVFPTFHSEKKGTKTVPPGYTQKNVTLYQLDIWRRFPDLKFGFYSVPLLQTVPFFQRGTLLPLGAPNYRQANGTSRGTISVPFFWVLSFCFLWHIEKAVDIFLCLIEFLLKDHKNSVEKDHGHYYRAFALYSTVDDSSNVLESCPTRKKKLTIQLLFYFFLRHVINVPCNPILCRWKIC